VREPFLSVYTGTDLDWGFLSSGFQLVLHSEMGSGGVIFADGIEQDYLEFLSGQVVSITIAQDTLNLVVPTEEG
jgi:hypothetical protein